MAKLKVERKEVYPNMSQRNNAIGVHLMAKYNTMSRHARSMGTARL